MHAWIADALPSSRAASGAPGSRTPRAAVPLAWRNGSAETSVVLGANRSAKLRRRGGAFDDEWDGEWDGEPSTGAFAGTETSSFTVIPECTHRRVVWDHGRRRHHVSSGARRWHDGCSRKRSCRIFAEAVTSQLQLRVAADVRIPGVGHGL